MPIRHCQACGLKVLIDEGQTTANPFFCQRCAAAGKAQESATGPRKETAVTGAPTVRISCPSCSASFNGRVPKNPARGECPVCRKQLILLPSGEIHIANEQDPVKGGPSAGTTKASEAVGGPSAVVSAPTGIPSASDNVLPSWLEDMNEVLPPPPPSVPEPAVATTGQEPESPLLASPTAETTKVPPPPPPPPPPLRTIPKAPAPAAKPPLRRPTAVRPAPSPFIPPRPPAPPSRWKETLACVLVALPIAAGLVCLVMGDSLQEPLKGFGEMLSKGLGELHRQILR